MIVFDKEYPGGYALTVFRFTDDDGAITIVAAGEAIGAKECGPTVQLKLGADDAVAMAMAMLEAVDAEARAPVVTQIAGSIASLVQAYVARAEADNSL